MGRKKKFYFASVNDSQEASQQDKNPAPQTSEEPKAEEPKTEEPKKEFQVFGEDIVLSKIDFIDYQKINNKMLFLQFHLMGQFDEKGEYYIKDDIKKDLIKAQKEIQEEDERGFVAHTTYAKVVFKFEVEITYKEEIAKADLYICEKIDDREIKTIISSFEAPNDVDFRIKVREKYNLVDVATTIRDEEVPNLNIWIYWQNEELLYWRDLYEMGSQFFVIRALAIFEGYGEIGKAIIAEYKNKLNEYEDVLPNRKFSKAKEILDEVINKFGGIEKVDDGKGKLKDLVKEFNKPFYKTEEQKTQIVELNQTKKATVSAAQTTKKATKGQIDSSTNKQGKQKQAQKKEVKTAKPEKKKTLEVSIKNSDKTNKKEDATAATAQKSNNTTKEADKNFSYTSTDETKKEQNKLSAKMADELYDEFEDTEENDIMTDNEDSVEVERDDSLVENLEVEKDMFVEK